MNQPPHKLTSWQWGQNIRHLLPLRTRLTRIRQIHPCADKRVSKEAARDLPPTPPDAHPFRRICATANLAIIYQDQLHDRKVMFTTSAWDGGFMIIPPGWLLMSDVRTASRRGCFIKVEHLFASMLDWCWSWTICEEKVRLWNTSLWCD